MRPQDAFGAAPDSFKASVASALHRIERENEHPARRVSFRLAICVGLAMLLLAGVVYAAANDWKLFDFYRDRFGMEISQEAQDAISQNNVSQQFTVGDVVVTLHEAVADGHYLYLSAKAEMREPGTAYLMGMSDTPTDYPAFDGQYPGRENRKSFLTLAGEEGKRLVSVDLHTFVTGAESISGICDSVIQADGTLHFMTALEYPTDADSIQVELTAYMREWSLEDDQYGEETLHKMLRFPIAVTPPNRQVTIDLEGAPFPGTAALMESITFTITPLSCYYEINFTVADADDKLLMAHTRNVLDFVFMDEAGERVGVGLTTGDDRRTPDDTHCVQSGSLRLTALPDTLTLRPTNDWGGAPDDVMVLRFADQ